MNEPTLDFSLIERVLMNEVIRQLKEKGEWKARMGNWWIEEVARAGISHKRLLVMDIELTHVPTS